MATSRAFNLAPVTITIRNGAPTSASVTINEDQDVIFQNQDNQAYLLQLWTNGNNHQIEICPVLPANGSLTYQPNPSNAHGNGRCHYGVVATNGRPTNPKAGGPNVIVIGSGDD